MVSFPRGPYPTTRMRRQRSHHQVRRLICENSLHASDLVWPCFITDNPQEEGKIDAMPEVKRYSLTQIVSAVAEAEDLGRRAIYHATHRDAYSGGLNNVYLVKEEGWKFLGAIDVKDLHEKYGQESLRMSSAK